MCIKIGMIILKIQLISHKHNSTFIDLLCDLIALLVHQIFNKVKNQKLLIFDNV